MDTITGYNTGFSTLSLFVEWSIKWCKAEQAREAIAKQSARPPLVNVGSFTLFRNGRKRNLLCHFDV